MASCPCGLAFCSQDKTARGTAYVLSVDLDRVGVLRTKPPFHLTRAGIFVDTNGMPIERAGSGGNICFKRVECAIAAE